MSDVWYTVISRTCRHPQSPVGGARKMNIEQAEKQAELVYEANVHLGEEEAQRLYDETLANLLADADAADADAVAGGGNHE